MKSGELSSLLFGGARRRRWHRLYGSKLYSIDYCKEPAPSCAMTLGTYAVKRLPQFHLSMSDQSINQSINQCIYASIYASIYQSAVCDLAASQVAISRVHSEMPFKFALNTPEGAGKKAWSAEFQAENEDVSFSMYSSDDRSTLWRNPNPNPNPSSELSLPLTRRAF